MSCDYCSRTSVVSDCCDVCRERIKDFLKVYDFEIGPKTEATALCSVDHFCVYQFTGRPHRDCRRRCLDEPGFYSCSVHGTFRIEDLRKLVGQ